MSLYNNETKLLLSNKLKDLETSMAARGLNVRFHTAEVSFASIQAKTLKSYFNNLPTTLELSDIEVDMLIDAGRDLLLADPGFKEFLAANNGRRTATASRSLSTMRVPPSEGE
jgi:NTE family protein